MVKFEQDTSKRGDKVANYGQPIGWNDEYFVLSTVNERNIEKISVLVVPFLNNIQHNRPLQNATNTYKAITKSFMNSHRKSELN